MKEAKKLKEGIDFVEDLKAGETFTDRGQGFTHCMIITLPSRDHVQKYIDHEVHQYLVKNYIAPICEDKLVLDFDGFAVENDDKGKHPFDQMNKKAK
jgi:hypothetical protein